MAFGALFPALMLVVSYLPAMLPPATPMPLPTRRPVPRFRRRKLIALTSLGLAGLVAGLLSGCSSVSQGASPLASSAESYASVTGNWRFASGAAAGSVNLAGALAVTGSQVSGHLHTLPGTCASTDGAAFPISGSTSSSGRMLLSGQDEAGRVFTISGQLAEDQRSMLEPAITVNGSCTATPLVRAPHANGDSGSSGQQYQAVTGDYAGSFTDGDGDSLAVDATLSQPTTPDANGVYHLTGSATFAGVPCLNSPVVTSSTVTGDQISATYTDPNSGATVTGSGTFSADAQTLTIDNWTFQGSCGSDSGSGILTRH